MLDEKVSKEKHMWVQGKDMNTETLYNIIRNESRK